MRFTNAQILSAALVLISFGCGGRAQKDEENPAPEGEGDGDEECDAGQWLSENDGCLDHSDCQEGANFPGTATSDARCYAGWIWRSELDPTPLVIGAQITELGVDLALASDEHVRLLAVDAETAEGDVLMQVELPEAEDRIWAPAILDPAGLIYSVAQDPTTPIPGGYLGDGAAKQVLVTRTSTQWSVDGLVTAPQLHRSAAGFYSVETTGDDTVVYSRNSVGEVLWEESLGMVVPEVRIAGEAKGELVLLASERGEEASNPGVRIVRLSSDDGELVSAETATEVNEFVAVMLDTDGNIYLATHEEGTVTLYSFSRAPELRWEARFAYENVGPVHLSQFGDDELVIAGTTTAALDNRGVSGRDVWAQIVSTSGAAGSSPLVVGWEGNDQLHVADASNSTLALTGVSHGEYGDETFVIALERTAFVTLE